MKTFSALTIALLLFLGCDNKKQTDSKIVIDNNSYNLGIIGGFGELVNCGVKKIALSDALPPAKMDSIYEEALVVAERNHVKIYRESDLIKTNLFPEDVAIGKDVLIIYNGTSLDEYLALKEEVKELEKEGKYTGEAKMQISRRFGRLLSYPTYRLNELLAENTSYRTMRDFGIKASNVFFYYKDLNEATKFYTETLGLELVADYSMAKIIRITSQSYLILVDEKYGMHKTNEPKTVKLSLITNQAESWYQYNLKGKVKIKQEFKSTTNADYFSILDPSGYTIEFIDYKQVPANENIVGMVNACKNVFVFNAKLAIKSTIAWLYYKDVEKIKPFYEETIGLKPIYDMGNTKIYQVSSSGMLGITNETIVMPFTENKAVNVSFILDSIDGWFNYCQKNIPFEMPSKEMEVGDEGKNKAFIGYDPEGYYLEFDAFYEHKLNNKLMEYLKK